MGYLSWDSHKRCSTFVFEKDFLETGWEVAHAISYWETFAAEAQVPDSWRERIAQEIVEKKH